jgi:hypothetical protein
LLDQDLQTSKSFFGWCGSWACNNDPINNNPIPAMMSFFPHFVVANYGLQIVPGISAGGWGVLRELLR